MKRLSLILLFLVSVIGVMCAHDDDRGKREKMFREVQEFKMKYLAQEMELSELQKKRFFEVYDSMEVAKRECYAEAFKMDRKLKHEKNASDKEYQKVTEAYDAANAKWLEEEKEYNEKFSEFLTPKQRYKMKEAETSFRAKLDEMRHTRKKDHQKKHDEH